MNYKISNSFLNERHISNFEFYTAKKQTIVPKPTFEYNKDSHSIQLSSIDYKTNHNEQLTEEEIIFLYELGNKFENQKDPIKEEIKEKRDAVKDLNYLFEKIKVATGDVYLNSLKSANGIVLPEEIRGSLYLDGLESAEGLVLPKKNTSYAFFKWVKKC